MESNLVLTTCFTKNRGPQHCVFKGGLENIYDGMKGWYGSLITCGLKGVIFHNELSDDYIKKYQNDQVSFVKYDQFHRYSYNDERFYCYKWYLEKNEVENVLFTDMFDVKFYGNPFSLYGTHDFYLGSELHNNWDCGWRKAKFRQAGLPYLVKGEKIYNAGIIGGHYKVIMGFLEYMIYKFDRLPKEYNLNTPLYLNFMNRVFKGKIFTGKPLHNTYYSYKPEGALIEHK